MHFRSIHNNTPTFDNIANIKCSLQIKMLGIMIDPYLQWDPQIDYLCKKLQKCIYSIRYLKNMCGKNTLLIVYYSYFHSLIRFNIINWGNCSSISRVLILQKRVIRIIECLKYKDSCRTSFKKLNVLTVPNTYIYEMCCFVRKHFSYFNKNLRNHEYSTRKKNLLLPDTHRTTLYQKGAVFNGCKIYNHLPDYLKVDMKLSEFKKSLKRHLLDKPCYTIEEFFS